MADLDDFEIDGENPKAREEGTREGEGPTLPLDGPEPGLPKPLLAAAALVLVAAIAGVFLVLRRPQIPPSPNPAAAAAPAPPTTPAETGLVLPALEGSDAFVRDLAKALSSHPQLGAWLAAKDLVRTLTVALQNVAEKRSPARFLPFLTPTTRFVAVEKAGRLVADPRSHAAYDAFADAVASLDAPECARVYGFLAPLFGAAYAELGYPAADFPKMAGRAATVLLKTPVPSDEIQLRRGRVFLEYADPKLESLSLAEKQLLRMGPRNARLVQAKAAEILKALGLDAPS